MMLEYPRLPEEQDSRRKITQADKDEIVRLRNVNPEFWTFEKLGRKFGVSHSTTSRICDPEQLRRANEQTKRIKMAKWNSDPEYRKSEKERIKKYLQKRKSTEPKFYNYARQFDRKSDKIINQK